MAIPLDEFRVPVVAYAVTNGEPRITATNGAFESVFESPSPETPVTAIFERFSLVNSTGDENPVTHLIRGDSVGMYLDGGGSGGPFFARILSSDGDTGYVVFRDANEFPGIAGTPAVDPVSSVISHDLRNPLDVAKAHLRAARETGDTEHFDAVADAHERMERIIRDVLTISRDRTVLDPTGNVSIEAAAKDAWQSVDTEYATLDVADTLPTATADSGRVQRLFENLFRNAVEHGSTGSRDSPDDAVEHGATADQTLSDDSAGSDSTSSRAANSARAVTVTVGALENGFYVADDGPGIPAGERAVVFEPGYSTREGGTGLGLAIVERIVVAHGWELTLTTAANGGTRVEVWF
ncbi:HAMP domain-containing histidine kinase [Haloferax volcanii]|uniref:histidine kinase n=3 Tax=Haloferax volcanii TaxID=2246 RepID=A0A6C0UWM5_HALVO|nr:MULTISPECIES: HAMP domain-containing sensor histidine kinase [Haloferax]ELZ78751.1 HTR-like protein [Haloferax lucentense DSM 14919]ELZ86443.1 HTR-like protein [Haloferax alexandrinus JCM 10717]NLV04423.1 sensor histidine kinase [Haloferax alexandrinus]QIB79844.1 HAMP domain-containing histidine kinase [Haloferax alexandrinus]TVT91007.1 HAMP domain-containing histidine kinase [Haloferax volcanii]